MMMKMRGKAGSDDRGAIVKAGLSHKPYILQKVSHSHMIIYIMHSIQESHEMFQKFYGLPWPSIPFHKVYG